MNSLVFYTLVLFSNPILSEANVPSLCDQPIIDAADRLGNGSIRVYRGDHYWELEGLPTTEAKVVGPFKVWYPNMLPIDRSTAIMTIISGADRVDDPWTENTYEFKRNRYWSWSPSGRPKFVNALYELAPSEQGFTAAFNDQMLDKTKKFPVMIAFHGIRVYYYKTVAPFQWYGDRKGYNLTGQFGENFPSDVNAAVAFPSQDPEKKYYVYLFKLGEYCFRPINGTKEEKDCETKWTKNEELFGCLKTTGSTSTQTIQTTRPTVPEPGKDDEDKPQTTTKDPNNSITNQNLKVVMVLMAFLIKLF